MMNEKRWQEAEIHEDMPSDRLMGLLMRPVPDPQKVVEDAANFALNEPALVHPYHTSIVKLRSDGCIEIWTGNNLGLRLDPKAAVLNIVAPTMKEHLGDRRSWMVGSWTADVGKQWTVKAAAGISLETSGSIELRADKDIRLVAGGNIHFD